MAGVGSRRLLVRRSCWRLAVRRVRRWGWSGGEGEREGRYPQSGIERKFLISTDQSRIAARPKIKRVPRSGVLDRLQAFLPQMAHANLELRRQMETTGQSHFDIENVDDCPDKVIEMNISLFEVDGDSGAELMSEDSESDTESLGEVTEANLKFPTTHQQRKGRIEVVSVDETKSD
ncbi:NOP protein chaperone 1 isoform X1 [Hemitrygon akajei]|uniref:NOP protein chaperone 1 isoform X1 n=1 Tax=Hemitrygon akajei TaxID=2704970 RepID=UPI003BF9F981